MSVEVVNEPRTYGPDGYHSFFRDAVLATAGDLDASTRIQRHTDEALSRPGVEGARALELVKSELRASNPHLQGTDLEREARAATSSTINGFITPQYLIDEYAVFRGTQRPFSDSCMCMPLPDVGLTINVPRFISAASAGVQASEGSSVVELDPTSTEVDSGEPVITISGQITSSQQALDRVRAGALTFDQLLYAQLRESYDQAVENYVLARAMNDGLTITESSGTFSLANFYQDIAKAREGLEDTAGNRIIPTHVFTTPDFYSYATRQLDGSGRPIIVPQFAPGNPLWPDTGNPAWRQFTGTVLPGNLVWFIDEAIQPSGANTNIIVSRPETILLLEGAEPIMRVVQGASVTQNLQAVVQMYNYLVCVPRYPSATAYITGAAYPTTEV